MQDQPEFHAVGGQLHRVIYEEIDQATAEVEIQAQIDEAQNQLNATKQVRQQAEQAYSDAEAAAEAASLEFDAAKKIEEEAESTLQKSVVARDSFTRAKQLATEQLKQSNDQESDTGTDESEPTDTEAIDLADRIQIAT